MEESCTLPPFDFLLMSPPPPSVFFSQFGVLLSPHIAVPHTEKGGDRRNSGKLPGVLVLPLRFLWWQKEASLFLLCTDCCTPADVYGTRSRKLSC